MGLPPSGGFAAKWLLLRAAVESGPMVVGAWCIVTGGLLTGGYVYRVLAAVHGRPATAVAIARPPRHRGAGGRSSCWRWR